MSHALGYCRRLVVGVLEEAARFIVVIVSGASSACAQKYFSVIGIREHSCEITMLEQANYFVLHGYEVSIFSPCQLESTEPITIRYVGYLNFYRCTEVGSRFPVRVTPDSCVVIHSSPCEAHRGVRGEFVKV